MPSFPGRDVRANFMGWQEESGCAHIVTSPQPGSASRGGSECFYFLRGSNSGSLCGAQEFAGFQIKLFGSLEMVVQGVDVECRSMFQTQTAKIAPETIVYFSSHMIYLGDEWDSVAKSTTRTTERLGDAD